MTAVADDARTRLDDLIRRARQEVQRLSKAARNNTAARFLADEIGAAEDVARDERAPERLQALTEGLRAALAQAGDMPVAIKDMPTSERHAERTPDEKRAAIRTLVLANPKTPNMRISALIGGNNAANIALIHAVRAELAAAKPSAPSCLLPDVTQANDATAALDAPPATAPEPASTPEPVPEPPAWLATLTAAPAPCGLRREKLRPPPDANPLPPLARLMAAANRYR